MSEVIDLSSDTENYPVKNDDTDSDTSIETNYQDIVAKYSDLKTKYNILPEITSKQSSTESEHLETIFDSSGSPDLPKKKTKLNAVDKEVKKLQKEKEKAERQAKREQQKLEKAQAKNEKKLLASNQKNLKPDESIKFITVFVDSEVVSSVCGTNIPHHLQESNIQYKIGSNLFPSTITWSRQKNNPENLPKNEECNDVILIILWNEFASLIDKKELRSHFERIRSIINKKIYLAIYGLDGYFRYHKNKTHNSKDKIYANSPKISRTDANTALIELQILHGVSHRLLETPQDLSAMIVQFTKSIAQIPYRLQKQLRQEQMEWFASGDNKDCIRVDKNGNGLFRLWQQQLTQYSMARLETAEAITLKYRTPTSLMHVYDNCATKEEGEKMLQDIPIRRAAGPLTAVRKIGPELSKKIYTTFTSLDGNELL